MRIADVPEYLRIAHKAGLSAFLKGPPGMGKTTLAREYAKKAKLRLINVHAPLVDLLDIKGVISTYNDEAKFLPLQIWPKADDDPVLVLIDEFPQCVPAIQNGFSQLLIEQIMGDVRLPKGSFVCATGNRKEDRAATHNINAHVVSRVMHMEMEKDHDAFWNWAASNKVHPHVIAYTKFSPDALMTFDPAKSQDPYATYRSWEYVSNVLKTNPQERFIRECVAGLVGKGVATTFMAFRDTCANLPDPQQALNHPHSFVAPSDPGVMNAICISLAYQVDDKTGDNFVILAGKIPVENAFMMLAYASRHWTGMKKNKSIKDWIAQHAQLIADSTWDI
jgi:hypothetical protein